MSSDRDRRQSLVDALPDGAVQVAISFLAELGEQEIVDVEIAAKLDLARAEQATMSPWKWFGAGSGCDPARGFPPCRGARSGALIASFRHESTRRWCASPQRAMAM